MEKTAIFLASIFHSLILGFFFWIWILLSLFVAVVTGFNFIYPKLMEFLTHIN